MARADKLIGTLSHSDVGLVSALQRDIDSKLRTGRAGSTFESVPSTITVDMPRDNDYERDFINPHNNHVAVHDPLIWTRIRSPDPQVESDVFIVFAFVFVRKLHQGTPAREARDRRNNGLHASPSPSTDFKYGEYSLRHTQRRRSSSSSSSGVPMSVTTRRSSTYHSTRDRTSNGTVRRRQRPNERSPRNVRPRPNVVHADPGDRPYVAVGVPVNGENSFESARTLTSDI